MKTPDKLIPSNSPGSLAGPAESFGRALREERRRRKLTLSHLASLSGMSASYLSRIEHGQLPPPSAKILHRLANALNIEVGALQAAAGLIPERVIAVLRDRPAVLTLLSLIDRQPENELLDLCDELLKRRERPN
jgi:transcriptional regulator with XRE-family HTH domain